MHFAALTIQLSVESDYPTKINFLAKAKFLECHHAEILYLPETRQHTFCHLIPHLLLRTGPTPKRIKTTLITCA